MTGTETSDLEAELLAVGALPPIGDYRYATAILDPDGRYVLVNQAYASLHGGTPDELRGRAEKDLVARTVAAALGENDLLALEAPAGTVTEERVMDSVGRRRVVMCRSALRDAQGYPLAVCRMYGSATARDRILAEFRRLLDALDPTGARARAFEAAERDPDAAGADAPTAPAAPMPGAGRDEAAFLLAKAAAVDEREARQKAEALLAEERSARERLDREQAAAAGRERRAIDRAAEVEAALAAERVARAELEQRAQATLDRLARLEATTPAPAGPTPAAQRAESAALATALAETRTALDHEQTTREVEVARVAEARRALDEERTARAAVTAQLEEALRVAEAERSARGALAAELARSRTVLEEERSARDELAAAADGAAGARSEATMLQSRLDAERRARELADGRTRALETQRAAERQARDRAEALLRELETRQAAERSAREQAENRARELEAQRAAERQVRQHAEVHTRQRETEAAAAGAAREQAATDARDQAELRAREREAQAAAAQAGREAAETRLRELEAQHAAESARRTEAERRIRELETVAAAERSARGRVEATAGDLETRRAAEHEARDEAERRVRNLEAERATEHTARTQAQARITQLEAERATEHTARTQAQARIAQLETARAADYRAREAAEARITQLEAERAAARETLEALRGRLGAGDPDPDPASASAPARTLAVVPEPIDEAPFVLPVAVPRPSAVSAAAKAARPAGPRRSRSATVHRSVPVPAGAVAAPLAALLDAPAGTGPGQSLRAVLPRALALIGEESGWEAVAMWHRAQARRPLTCLGIWTRPGADLDWFESISWRAKLDLGEAPSGDVDPAGRLTWVADLGDEGGSVRERMARSADLRSRAVVPLADGEALVGALEVYSRAARPSDEATMTGLASTAGLLAPMLLREMEDAAQRRWRV
jgi:hypothetical protein